jgi:hypothetical protein
MAEQTKQARTPPALTSRDHELIVNALTSVKGGIFTVSADTHSEATATLHELKVGTDMHIYPTDRL